MTAHAHVPTAPSPRRSPRPARGGRYARLALVAGTGALLAGGLLPWSPGSTLGAHVQDASHPIGFAAVAFALTLASAGARPLVMAFATGIGLLALGVGIELVQESVGRTASIDDVAGDAAGIVAGALAAVAVRSTSRAVTAVALGTGIAALGAGLAPHAPFLVAAATRPSWPVLEDFSGPFALERVRGLAADSRRIVRTAGSKVLELRFGGGPWSGVLFPDPAPDWRDASALALVLDNPGTDPMTLLLRVHDADRDGRDGNRFRRFLVVPPGTTRFEISLREIGTAGPAVPDGRVSLDRIDRVVLSGDAELAGRSIRVVELSLVPARRQPHRSTAEAPSTGGG